MEQVIVIVGCDNRVEFGPGMPGRYNCMLAEERAGMETRPYGFGEDGTWPYAFVILSEAKDLL